MFQRYKGTLKIYKIQALLICDFNSPKKPGIRDAAILTHKRIARVKEYIAQN